MICLIKHVNIRKGQMDGWIKTWRGTNGKREASFSVLAWLSLPLLSPLDFPPEVAVTVFSAHAS